MLVRPLSTVDNTRYYTLVYSTVDSGLTITQCSYLCVLKSVGDVISAPIAIHESLL